MCKYAFLVCCLLTILLSGCTSNQIGQIFGNPYSVIITDSNSIKGFLEWEGIGFEQIWIPQDTDIKDFKKVLQIFIENKNDIKTETCFDRDYILNNLSRYNCEYSGFIKNGRKYIICNMVLYSDFNSRHCGKEFTMILDGGCGIVRVIYDFDNKTVTKIDCNGVG